MNLRTVLACLAVVLLAVTTETTRVDARDMVEITIDDPELFQTLTRFTHARADREAAFDLIEPLRAEGFARTGAREIFDRLSDAEPDRLDVAFEDEALVVREPERDALRLFRLAASERTLGDLWLADLEAMTDLIILAHSGIDQYRLVYGYVGSKVLMAWDTTRDTGRQGDVCRLLLDVTAITDGIDPPRAPILGGIDYDDEWRRLLYDVMELFDRLYLIRIAPGNLYAWLPPESDADSCDPEAPLVLTETD